jgi:hypothetical protein
MKMEFDNNGLEPLITTIALGRRMAPKTFEISCAIGVAAIA